MKTINHNKFATVAVAMFGVAFFAAGAHADEANSLTVRYADLNLNTAAGTTVLYQRIQTAAKKVCGEVDGRELQRAAAVKACQDQAIERSVRAVNNPQLTHVANGQGHAVRSDAIIVASAR